MTATKTKKSSTKSQLKGKPPANQPPKPGSFWHHSAPKHLARASFEPDAEGWRAWKAHLNRDGATPPLETLLRVKRPALLWAWPDDLVGSDSEPLVRELAEVTRNPTRSSRGELLAEQLGPWLAEARGARLGAAYLLECIALCHALRPLSHYVEEASWWELLDHLLQTASAPATSAAASPLLHQLQAGELPLALCYNFPEIQPCRDLRASARGELSTAIVELLDGEGMIGSKHLDEMVPLLASWTRCRMMGENWKKGAWNSDAEVQYEWAVRQALRFLRSDGAPVFSRNSRGRLDLELFQASLRQTGDKEDFAAAQMTLPGGGFGAAKKVDPDDLPSPAANSEWAGVALLRRNWSRQSERLAVKYGESDIELELCCGEDILLTGVWDAEVRVDQKPIRQPYDWEEVCWYSDDDVDYLEIETELAPDFRLQRQLLLAREDRFLILTDIILGTDVAGTIDYRGHLPLAEGVEFLPENDTREGILRGGKRSCLVVPLALPEWRDAHAVGALSSGHGRLTLSQQLHGRNLCCPLFIDLDPRRLLKQRTWRQLTVAESLEIVPADVAVSYRMQCGKAQWLYYRSLLEPANRSVLGQNLASDCMVGRFFKDGEVEELLEIE